jgi:hypothetical protein
MVKLLGLTPSQLNITEANFNAVMALPTVLRPSSMATANSTATSTTQKLVSTSTKSVSKSSTVSTFTTDKSSTATSTMSGFLPDDERDPDIFQYEDLSYTITSSPNATGSKSSIGLVVTPPPAPSPLMLPLPDYSSVRLNCDTLLLAGPSASVLDLAAVGRMADVEVADCVELLGRLDFSPSAMSSIAMDVLDRGVVGAPRQPYSSGNQLRGNAMTMLGNLLPSLVALAPNMVDFNFTSNFDGLAVLGQKFVEPPSNGNHSIPSNLGASLGNKSSSSGSGGNSSSLAAVLVSLYLVANPSITGGQQQLVRQLSAVEVVGLAQLLCGLNATQWSTMVPAGLATGVREAVLASLTCRPTDDVSTCPVC